MMCLWEMSLSAGVLIGVILIIRTLTLQRLPKKTFLVLWGIVLCRLLIPFSIPSPLSFYSLFQPAEAEQNIAVGTPAAVDVFDGFAAEAPPRTILPDGKGIPWQGIVWGMGAVVCAGLFLTGYCVAWRRFRTAIPLKEEKAVSWIQSQRLRRPLKICQSDRIKTPLCYGVLRPVILLPKGLDLEQDTVLQSVLTHELVHIKRFDGVLKLVMAAAVCLHWFNPFVWVMYVFFNRDMEVSCDETALRILGGTEKSRYAMALIQMEETKSGFLPFYSSFCRNAMEERITAIMKLNKNSIAAIFAAVAITFGVASVFATSAMIQANARLPETTMVSSTSLKGTKSDYQSLLSLMTEDYQNKTVEEFNQLLISWASEDPERYDRMESDRIQNTYPEYLNEKEQRFLAVTVRASGCENAVMVRSHII